MKNTIDTNTAGGSAVALSARQKGEIYGTYEKRVHLLGRMGLGIALILLLAAPFAMGAVLGAGPNWGAFWTGFAQVAIIYWPTCVVEFLIYSPMLGSGASYLAFITGNLLNLKIPCAANAREICATEVGTPENDVVSTLSVATSSLVTMAVLALGVMMLVPLRPVLENPALQPAFNNVIPALFGALAFKHFAKNLKIAVVPLAVMCVLFVALPSLISNVSFLILLSGGITIGFAALLYRKDKL